MESNTQRQRLGQFRKSRWMHCTSMHYSICRDIYCVLSISAIPRRHRDVLNVTFIIQKKHDFISRKSALTDSNLTASERCRVLSNSCLTILGLGDTPCQ